MSQPKTFNEATEQLKTCMQSILDVLLKSLGLGWLSPIAEDEKKQ